MNATGDADLLVAARGALLDALKALHPHLNAVIVIGAQAIYLHTGAVHVALAEATKDSDLALDTRALADLDRAPDTGLLPTCPVSVQGITSSSPKRTPASIADGKIKTHLMEARLCR